MLSIRDLGMMYWGYNNILYSIGSVYKIYTLRFKPKYFLWHFSGS